MALSALELAQIVWAETRKFGPSRADGKGDLNVLRRMIAQLAASTGGEGFPNRDPLPGLDDPADGVAAKQVGEIADAARDAKAPQSRVIIWEASEDLSGLRRDATPSPPAPWATLANDAMTLQFMAPLADERRFVAFSRAPAAGDDGAPFVNAMTGTGVPDGAPVSAAAPPPPTKPVPRWLPWFLGFAGVALFVVGGGAAAILGQSMGDARRSLNATAPAYRTLILNEVAKTCVQNLHDFPGGDLPLVCAKLLKDDRSGLDDAKLSGGKGAALFATFAGCQKDPNAWVDAQKQDCSVVWSAAIDADENKETVTKTYFFGPMRSFSAFLTGLETETGSATIVAPYLLALVGVGALLVALGLGTKGRVAGIWIDTRNRVSLARAQATLWTLVVLSGYFVISMFNVGFAAFAQTPLDLAKYSAFPQIPQSIWAALGISAVASPIVSKLFLVAKDTDDDLQFVGGDKGLDKRGVAFFDVGSSGLDKRDDPSQASLADIFMGEENANADTVDVARLQNVLISIMLVASYLSFLLEMMSHIRRDAILGVTDQAIFQQLPFLGATFTSLLAASHATYLASKAHNSKDLGQPTNQGASTP